VQDDRNKVPSENALQTLQRNEFLRRLEWGLEEISPLKHSIHGAIFDVERITPERNAVEVDGNRVLKFKFSYTITNGEASPWVNALYKLTVDSKTAAKIDAYLNEGTNVLNVQIQHTRRGIRHKISPYEVCQSIPGFRTALPVSSRKR
jgi:hypothetical protein